MEVIKQLIIRILNKLGCNHKWDVYSQCEVRSDFGGRYHRHTLICQKCGKIRQIRL